MVALGRAHFPDLVRDCPELTTALVHTMIDRARDYRAAQVHDERMQSLGGPRRTRARVEQSGLRGIEPRAIDRPLLNDLQAASRALAGAHLTDEQLERIDALWSMCTDAAPSRSPLEAADREEEFSDWLHRHGIDPDTASSLAAAGVSVAALDGLASVLPAATLGVAIRWVASDSAVRQVAARITTATGRIHDLVSAVKGFTFMDREGVPENVDIARGLADTVAMLENKARGSQYACGSRRRRTSGRARHRERAQSGLGKAHRQRDRRRTGRGHT